MQLLEFKKLNPHLWEYKNGYGFFECPINGDEESIIVSVPNKGVFFTDLFELPTFPELSDLIDTNYFEDLTPYFVTG